ncbi:MAG: DUF2497 domain-containing protein [Candidatus Paracaedibacteraceae bacterium]|nr:DUF2497 domain-containing protein [Candidatus Paracaedibacteraceae bacterium]
MTTSNHSDDDQEMSMDEILASIRRYVSSDEPDPKETVKTSERTPSLNINRNEDIVRLDESKKAEPLRPSSVNNDAFMRKGFNESRVEAKIEQRAELKAEPRDFRPEPWFAASKQTQPQQATATKEKAATEELISDNVLASTMESFSKLRDASLQKTTPEIQPTATAPTLDQLFENLARPMIREWLNTNLPPMVERMVLKEIQRITNSLTN